jgi:hypothetical protein
MSFVMERNPRVFSTAPEETIRDHYLVQLNGQYEGSATGETFNGQGRTNKGSHNIGCGDLLTSGECVAGVFQRANSIL